MKGLLVSSGNKINKELLEKYGRDSFIVCADGGIKNFVGTDIIPDAVVGDFDSIDKEGLKFIKDNKIAVEKYPSEKDFTDTEAALNILLEQGVDDLVILSATGTRMDHTLSNMLLLEGLYTKIKSVIIDDNNEIYYVKKGVYSYAKNGFKYISVIPISEELEYSTKGLKYETNHLIIKKYPIGGVSNEILKDSCTIEVHRGEGFIIKSKD
ncbi:thiamine diphosphokinase [Anaerosphaera multitolerans]|uniref:Thiamine diphosphokinase n=1 Tax=Anaerosphaera multitolerans TaxID=2487351 RepID=A0A437S6U5_9FIRM|nr:thiamine diphosphokinase [Anaerosphaera multitolerans]RVU54755.1 thiamine diphosphokinase [Anaerosphaera multitolerans]